MTPPSFAVDPADIKACCAQMYSSDVATMLLGENLHPGGTTITSRLAGLLGLDSSSVVLDVACGRGASAIHLALSTGCRIEGVDFSDVSVDAARQAAQAAGVSSLCTFTAGDAESLAFADASFDALICECAFCTFPDKQSAAGEFARVLRPGGVVGMSDVTRSGHANAELDSLVAWVACIADARSVEEYTTILTGAGLHVEHAEAHDEALLTLAERVRARLILGRTLSTADPEATAGWDIDRAQELANAAVRAIRAGTLGYAIITARRR